MKIIRSYLWFTIAIISILMISSCDDKIEYEYSINVPVYLSKEDFKNAVKSEDPQEMIDVGKIYFYKDYILINEKLKGIHIIDNSNPADPKNVSFINIPGNIDMAIKDDILYADSFTDLVAIDFSTANQINIQSRFENVFPFVIPPTNNKLRIGQVDPTKGVVIGWEVKRVSEEYQEPRYYPIYTDMIFNTNTNGIPKSDNGSTGKAGSMARFMIYENTLYTLNNRSSLNIYDISNPDNLVQNGDIRVQWDIETIFTSGTNLFFGARSGMYIYDISNPFIPTQISQYRHFTGCDPVIVDGNYAYITLRSGNFCGRNTSQLDVVDLTDIETPTRIISYSMDNPYGLAKDGDLLFICDGTSGLKIYNANDPLTIGNNLIKQYNDITPFDVITIGNILITISAEGLFQYNYSDINNIHLLSSISISNNNQL